MSVVSQKQRALLKKQVLSSEIVSFWYYNGLQKKKTFLLKLHNYVLDNPVRIPEEARQGCLIPIKDQCPPVSYLPT